MTSACQRQRQRAVNVKKCRGRGSVPGAAKVTAINHRPIIQETINTGDPERRGGGGARRPVTVVSRRAAS